MATLLEAYKGRLDVANRVYSKATGKQMSNQAKMTTAVCLDNTAKFLTEAFAHSAAPTQSRDMGMFKKFCLDITTLTQPNLIVNDLFMVAPMTAFTGYVTYMEFALGQPKGGVGGFVDGKDEWATVTMNPFMYGEMSEGRVNYTGSFVKEAITSEMEMVTWKPVIKGSAKAVDAVGNDLGPVEVEPNGKIVGKLPEGAAFIAYQYDNVIVPQNALPTLVGRMSGIALQARARRIAIQYSQIAAYMAKTDYGMDFDATIAQQAQAELMYQVDSEAVELVKNAAKDAEPIVWVDEELDTIGYSLKAEGFARAIERAKMQIYSKTRRFMPNWMIVSPEIMPILTFVKGFVPASSTLVNGPYLAGTVSGMQVFVSPALAGEKQCLLGVNAADGKTSVGIYAPYMPLVPTQLLGYADGGMSQGFSTLYDMQILNKALLSKIQVLDGNGSARINCYEGSEVEI